MEIGSQSAGIVVNGQDKLEDLFEEIGKSIGGISLIYPNDGKWTIYTHFSDETFSGETVYEALKEFQKSLK